MRIALAQINSVLGDFENNCQKIKDFTLRAHEEGADMVVFPECALYGYPPKDTLESHLLVANQGKQLKKLLKLPIPIVVGLITKNESAHGKPYYNSAALIKNGKVRFFHKKLLPSYDVFDEARYVESGPLKSRNIFSHKGRKVLVTICEDIWAWPTKGRSEYAENPLRRYKKSEVDVVINLSASPYSKRQWAERRRVAKATTERLNADLIYVNLVGAQDELIFDGGSFAMSPSGRWTAHAKTFEEDLTLIDLDQPKPVKWTSPPEVESVTEALTLGIRDFCRKIGIQRAHLGLSGGIDSAVVLALACRALGPENVRAVALPTRFNAEESMTLAKQLAKNLGCQFDVVEIDPLFQQMSTALEGVLDLGEMSLTHENLQARLRGVVLMAYSNRLGSLLLTTGNKAEYATGYATLYGDMCGGLAPIADLTKRDVYAVARHFNREREVIPDRIITRPPSAELRPDQRDDQSLPDYDQLDDSVDKIVERRQNPTTEVDHFVFQSLLKTEFKRWQAPPVLRVTSHAFGRGRRLPVANRFS